jgi:hypothetical protein
MSSQMQAIQAFVRPASRPAARYAVQLGSSLHAGVASSAFPPAYLRWRSMFVRPLLISEADSIGVNCIA